MNNIQKYFAGREQFIELLEAVGIRTLEQFASADPSTVLPELHQAKRMLKLQTEIPSAPVFREWVNQALSSPTAPEPELLPIHEGDGLPLATPVDPSITDSSENRRERGRSHTDGPPKHLSAKARLQEEHSYQPAKHVHTHKEPKTYLRKKGIKHMTSFRTWMGAVIVLLLFICILFSISVTTLVLLNGERGWPLISLCFGPWILALILYLSLALPRKCSVCGAHVFSFKNTLAIRRPTTFPCSGTYLPRHSIYYSSAGSVARPAVLHSNWGNPEPSNTDINETLTPAPDFPDSRSLSFSFPLYLAFGKRFLLSVRSFHYLPLFSHLKSALWQNRRPHPVSRFHKTASGATYPPLPVTYSIKNPPSETGSKPSQAT